MDRDGVKMREISPLSQSAKGFICENFLNIKGVISMQPRAMTTHQIRHMKGKEPIAMITAYDFPAAKLAEEAGADILLVGDSLGMVVLGYDSTIPVTIDDMVHHTKAVSRAAKQALVVADLPFLTYHGDRKDTLKNAGRLMQEAGAKAVKMEGGAEIVPMVQACVQAGIPVMGHLGLTPQSVHQVGGYRVQGREFDAAKKMLEDAQALVQAGVFAIVLELIPEPLAAKLTELISVPVIGIGAGRLCDGQVLVYHDLLQYASPVKPKFVKAYASIGDQITVAIRQYVQEVKSKDFPDASHVFGMDDQTKTQLDAHTVNPETSERI